jgi:hypothetical protein
MAANIQNSTWWRDNVTNINVTIEVDGHAKTLRLADLIKVHVAMAKIHARGIPRTRPTSRLGGHRGRSAGSRGRGSGQKTMLPGGRETARCNAAAGGTMTSA